MTEGCDSLSMAKPENGSWKCATIKKVLQIMPPLALNEEFNEKMHSHIWVNAIYYLTPSNGNGIPICKDRFYKITELALPYAKVNPTIFWNSYCLYAAIGEVEKAFECIENTLRFDMSRNQLLALITELANSEEGEVASLAKAERWNDFIASFLYRAKSKIEQKKSISHETHHLKCTKSDT